MRILLFAGLRERAGARDITLELSDGARVADALEELRWLTGETRVVMAINREYADEQETLHGGDELALIPPVSGGAPDDEEADARVHVRISAQPLSLDALLTRVRNPRAGAIVSFQGVTREVPALEYEAYTEMAQRELHEIVSTAVERHGLCSAAAEHRTGTVELSEPSVVVAASAPHRGQAFAGAREIIDRIKLQAPIWKREEGRWLEQHTPAAARTPLATPGPPPER